jgi:hypothetical protein
MALTVFLNAFSRTPLPTVPSTNPSALLHPVDRHLELTDNDFVHLLLRVTFRPLVSKNGIPRSFSAYLAGDTTTSAGSFTPPPWAR